MRIRQPCSRVCAVSVALFGRNSFGTFLIKPDSMHCIGRPLNPEAPPIPINFQANVQAACRNANPGSSKKLGQKKIDDDNKQRHKPLEAFWYKEGGWSLYAMQSNDWTSCSDRFGTTDSDGDLGNLRRHCDGNAWHPNWAQGAINHEGAGGQNMGLTLLFYDPLSTGVSLPHISDEH
ncbi:MAG: hypothetical protein Q9227_008885 [Pyrenula ochraceoflavens]